MEENEIKPIQERKEEYKLERNEYVTVRREEEKRYEKIYSWQMQGRTKAVL